MGCFKLEKIYKFKNHVMMFHTSHRYMGGAPKPRRRLTPAICADRINELNAEEQKMMLEMLVRRQKGKFKNRKLPANAFNISEPEVASNLLQENDVMSSNSEVIRPSSSQLRQLAIFQAMPFVGFGFLDNFIMIVAGEYIDTHIGTTLCISTMAAAALGNTVSDVFGIASAWYVEHWSGRLGIHAPALSLEQLQLTSCRVTANAGRAIGVAVGCILGMIPLFFIENNKDEDKTNDETRSAETTNS